MRPPASPGASSPAAPAGGADEPATASAGFRFVAVDRLRSVPSPGPCGQPTAPGSTACKRPRLGRRADGAAGSWNSARRRRTPPPGPPRAMTRVPVATPRRWATAAASPRGERAGCSRGPHTLPQRVGERRVHRLAQRANVGAQLPPALGLDAGRRRRRGQPRSRASSSASASDRRGGPNGITLMRPSPARARGSSCAGA